jgi:hypothetical protein
MGNNKLFEWKILEIQWNIIFDEGPLKYQQDKNILYKNFHKIVNKTVKNLLRIKSLGH